MDLSTVILIGVIIWHLHNTEEFMKVAAKGAATLSCCLGSSGSTRVMEMKYLMPSIVCFLLCNVRPAAAILSDNRGVFEIQLERDWNISRNIGIITFRNYNGTDQAPCIFLVAIEAWLDAVRRSEIELDSSSESFDDDDKFISMDTSSAGFDDKFIFLICNIIVNLCATGAQLLSAIDIAIRVVLWQLSWLYGSSHFKEMEEARFMIAAMICFSLWNVRPKAAPAILLEPSDANLWSQLDFNLLEEIRGRLTSPTDQARFRVVCTAWRAAARSSKTTKSIPWKVKLDRSLASVGNKLEFRIYDPSSLSAFVHNILWADLGIPTPPSYKNVGASRKNNWFFICISKPRLFFWTRRYFFLYAPYTKKIITLPKLDYQSRFRFRRTFSTDPDSPNCVFFLSETFDADKIVVITYCKSDTKWKAREFDRVQEFVPCDCIPIFFKGIFYLISPFGQVASYNIVDDKFKFESLFIDEVFAQNYNSFRIYQVFELNGELMLIYFGSKKKNNDTLLGKQCIKMYDWSNKIWIPVRTLGKNAIFVGDQILSVAIVNTEETGYGRVLPNKIYRFCDLGCIIYSLEDGNLVEYRPSHSNLLEDDCGDLPEYNDNSGITSSDATKAFYWLEPPTVLY
ncbi:uncharacterized protein LOC108196823 [Daucus carota subsp. sativus]|uniref:uncharacterized protein LOC108196823 n=1 Tax=Daucus carota subsp. sativus TaxID=79200 RepID=UPI0007EF2A0D|nr:PREDICTED: uncharacterized protein LOC108196823 [Daucus carota subsp. sativus]XP_017219758.1 PREDICTED: uncharacterized protein LOC108196823 [Daucus carota subsp. sativus]XP_017219759.1 PREDICTED: uncharacterized protein LOC108196823 [Daucus carota subsp. sativus]XP_017219760.1 PREDICTED: uncharacterized protein LOC108196823 [Daucus carota subsp. sativus]